MKKCVFGLLVSAVSMAVQAQPRYDMHKLHTEPLGRGTVAVRSGDKVVIGWRLLPGDAADEAFDVYRNGVKLNTLPLKQGGTQFVDAHPLKRDAVYEVRGGRCHGRFTLKANAPDGYLAVKLQRPAGGVTPDGYSFRYHANDASVADVDGDGQYEIVLKWDPSNAHDNAHNGYTGPTLFDCYRLDGTLLWRIDMGINIRSGAHYVPFIFYDLDGDGKAEFLVRTSDGTRDGAGRVIGDAQADYRHTTGRILTGREYLTVFDGFTGRALDSQPYVPERGRLADWGDNYANRSDRMLAAVGYLDGCRASAIFCRGYYTRTVLAAWDWDGRALRQRWVFDTNQPQWASYAGQGNHNLRVADVDGDGCDEITYGSMAVDHDGSGLYNTGMGHGDAIHLMCFSPDSPQLQVWDCHENRRDGSDFRDARTGKVLFQVPSKSDVGRCMAADIDPTNPGVEMWSTDSHGIRNIKGEVLYATGDASDPQHQQHLKMGDRHLSVNFGIWWDGDLLRELLDHETVTKFNWRTHTIDELVRFPGIVFNNGTKSNPCLSADILGDWREEVMARTPESDELRIFVSTIPTEHRLTCLMADVPYRLSVAMQNVGYNQPPEPGFYLGAKTPSVAWDEHSLLIDGRRVCPVMGEVHYSRIPAEEWTTEVRKMQEGGVTMLACYVFWNHVEETEGVFNWSGQRSLRRFLEVCRQAQMPVVLRVGPFCHGEVRCGGLPDWLFAKGCKMRSEDPVFLSYTRRLYQQIFTQVEGLQWQDGGPVVALQFDNEYRGHGSYLMALKRMAQEIGFQLPFYTRTGWPELASPVPYGEMIPLYGDYADGFWERSLQETAGNYYKAFNFKAFRSSTAIATEQLGQQQARINQADEQYPYFTCELGGGMMTAYHRRPYLYPEDAYAMAVVKLGSGSNLLGYYMYHGGTNPDGLTWLNEMQRTLATNYNDMPVKTYDFQAPLGEFGQKNPHYYMLRKLHLFMHDWGEQLAPMLPVFPCSQDIAKGDDSFLRWAYRTKDGSGFIFISNYERLQSLSAKRNVQLSACDVQLPPLTIPAGTICILPVNIDGIRYATGQLVAKRNGRIYMMQIPGVPTTIALQNGKVLRNVKPKGLAKPVCQNIYLLTVEQAEHLFLPDEKAQTVVTVNYRKQREAGPLRTITIGVNKVAEEPTDQDFEAAAVYTIQLPQDHRGLLQIDYRGDCARLYADGRLVADNFYNGRPFLMGLWRLPGDCRQLELRILPLQKDMPVYFPREADTTPGEQVLHIKKIQFCTKMDGITDVVSQ